MKMYGVLESEMKSLGTLCTQIVILSVAGIVLLAITLGIIVDIQQVYRLDGEVGSILTNVVAPVCAFLSMLCYGGVLYVIVTQQEEIAKIRKRPLSTQE